MQGCQAGIKRLGDSLPGLVREAKRARKAAKAMNELADKFILGHKEVPPPMAHWDSADFMAACFPYETAADEADVKVSVALRFIQTYQKEYRETMEAIEELNHANEISFVSHKPSDAELAALIV